MMIMMIHRQVAPGLTFTDGSTRNSKGFILSKALNSGIVKTCNFRPVSRRISELKLCTVTIVYKAVEQMW